MGKSYSEKGYFGQENFLKEQAERFGLNIDDYSLSGSGREFDLKSRQDLENDIAREMHNDYDSRTTINAAIEANSKGADKLPTGISNIDEAYQVHKYMKNAHRDAGNTGNFSSANDYGNVSRDYVERAAEKRMDGIALTDDLNKIKEDLMSRAIGEQFSEGKSDPAEPSDRLASAQSRLSAAAFDPSSLYVKSNSEAPKTDDQKDATRNFFDQYKLDVATGANLQNQIYTNLSNAANTVTNVYGR